MSTQISPQEKLIKNNDVQKILLLCQQMSFWMSSCYFFMLEQDLFNTGFMTVVGLFPQQEIQAKVGKIVKNLLIWDVVENFCQFIFFQRNDLENF